MIITDILLQRFWSGWIERFESNSDKYITPNHPLVLDEVDKVGDIVGGDEEKALELWIHILENIQYRLSKKWKTPAETLTSGIGDCEDMDFLLLSMFPHYGITDGELVIGSLETWNGRKGLHTWVEIDGGVVDPTGDPVEVDAVNYSAVKRFSMDYKGF